MLKRRQFIGALTALGGSAILSACGGGTDDATSSTGSAARSQGATAKSASANGQGTTSPEGTTMPSASNIIDSTGAVWTLTNGVIYRNGSVVGVNYNVSLVLWYGGKIWCCN